MKNKYIPTAAGLYLNYLIHGMGVLLITLNMAHLQEQWGTDKAGVSIVISSLGIGKLATIVTGFLSDRFGRKPFIYLGILSYLIFFVGTYDTPGVSHVGIYVGGGKMLHCGDPIQYADINTSYWQSHFYAFGRPPYN